MAMTWRASAAQIDDNTKGIYVEAMGNPRFNIPDFEGLSALAKERGIPLIVDNTLGACGACCARSSTAPMWWWKSATKWSVAMAPAWAESSSTPAPSTGATASSR